MRVVFAGRRPPTGTGERIYPLGLPARVAAQRPLALAILADYGNPVEAVDRINAIVDWIARTAIHSHYGLRLPTPYSRGAGCLPAGETWSTVQAQWTAQKQNDDNAYWNALNHDGTVMLDRLLGTLDVVTGTRAADGAMSRVTDDGSQAHYRYNSLATIRSVWCTHQHSIAIVLLAALGYVAVLCHQTGHDPLRVQYGLSGEWGYWCATYNEHYALSSAPGVPLDQLTLRDLTVAGRLAEVQRVRHVGPTWDALQYVSASYLADHPEGWPFIGTSLDSRIVPGTTSRLTRALDDADLAASANGLKNYPRTTERTAAPYFGAYLMGLPVPGASRLIIRVGSGWPGTVGFVRRVAGGAWQAVASTTLPGSTVLTATVPVRQGAGRIEVAPVDANGQRGPAVAVEG